MGIQFDLPYHLHLWPSVGTFSNILHIFYSLKCLLLQAAPHYSYSGVCAIYFLACLGLGGNIPIDATIALEFLPQSRRSLVALLAMWQPVGVVAASAVAYGTAAKYRCAPELPSCHSPEGRAGAACCTVASNMGWRYELLILGLATLFVFCMRFFVFKFYESPKFLLSRGKEEEAIAVLHKIAIFNKVPEPTLTIEDFNLIDEEASEGEGVDVPSKDAKTVVKNFLRNFKHLKVLFTNKLQTFTFALLAVAYMV